MKGEVRITTNFVVRLCKPRASSYSSHETGSKRDFVVSNKAKTRSTRRRSISSVRMPESHHSRRSTTTKGRKTNSSRSRKDVPLRSIAQKLEPVKADIDDEDADGLSNLEELIKEQEEDAKREEAATILGKRDGPSIVVGNGGVAWIDGNNYIKRMRSMSANVEPVQKLNESTYKAPPQKDPWCDPDKPRVLQFQDISAAAYTIRDGVMKTPCTRSSQLSSVLGMDIYFKKEFLHVTGSFKERGARYTLCCLSEDQKRKGVFAASAGNHALALAYHGQLLGIPVTVVMPLIAPLMKICRCRQYGATVLVKGEDIGEAKEIAMKMAEDNGSVYVNGYDQSHILAGQGTMGLEILEQVDGDVDAVIIPVGGAGLIAGAGMALKHLRPSLKIIGVEGEKCPSMTKALEAGHPVYTKIGSTIADGLSVPVVGYNAFETVKAHKLLDDLVTVPEEFLALAILKLTEMEKAVVEGGGAVGLAALLAGKLPYLKGKRVVCILTGGNIDTTILGRAIERALAEDGRLVRFVVVVSDRPGGIAELTSLLARLGASIKDIYHERAWLKNDIFNVRVKLTAETRDREHAKEVEDALNAHYSEVVFNPII